MKVYVIGGKAGVGKNTLAQYLKEELENYNYKPCIIQITEPLYSYARNYFNWDGNMDHKPRKFLQQMGIEIINKKLGKKDFLLNRLYENIEILSNYFDVFIVPDIRLIYEFNSIKNKYDEVITIKLERDDYNNHLTGEESNHITETEIDNYNEFSYILKNTDKNKLKKDAINIVKMTEEKER